MDNNDIHVILGNQTDINTSSVINLSEKGVKQVTVEKGFICSMNLTNCVLTVENLRDIIGKLGDNTGNNPKTLTLGVAKLAMLTTEEIAIATNKNFTLI